MVALRGSVQDDGLNTFLVFLQELLDGIFRRCVAPSA
jgi:hypothetical protein